MEDSTIVLLCAKQYFILSSWHLTDSSNGLCYRGYQKKEGHIAYPSSTRQKPGYYSGNICGPLQGLNLSLVVLHQSQCCELLCQASPSYNGSIRTRAPQVLRVHFISIIHKTCAVHKSLLHSGQRNSCTSIEARLHRSTLLDWESVAATMRPHTKKLLTYNTCRSVWRFYNGLILLST